MLLSQICLVGSVGTGDEEMTTIETRYTTILHEHEANRRVMLLRITITIIMKISGQSKVQLGVLVFVRKDLVFGAKLFPGIYKVHIFKSYSATTVNQLAYLLRSPAATHRGRLQQKRRQSH